MSDTAKQVVLDNAAWALRKFGPNDYRSQVIALAMERLVETIQEAFGPMDTLTRAELTKACNLKDEQVN